MLYSSQLEYLSFYTCELEGKEACSLVKKLFPFLPKIKQLNIEGNLVAAFDLMQLKDSLDTDCKD